MSRVEFDEQNQTFPPTNARLIKKRKTAFFAMIVFVIVGISSLAVTVIQIYIKNRIIPYSEQPEQVRKKLPLPVQKAYEEQNRK